MEEDELGVQIKAVKKNTYNAVINQTHLKLDSENSPNKNKNVPRSQSFKKITRFVPQLRPRKSTFVPTPLKLNKENKQINEEKEKLSGDEIEIIENDSSCSSISSSDMDLSDENIMKEKEKEKEKSKKDLKAQLMIKKSSCNIIDKIESIEEENDDDEFYLNEIKENDDNQDNKTKNMKLTRKKLSQIRVKTGIIKFKETDEVVHDNFKNNFDIGLKKFENEDDTPKDFHASLNLLELKKNKSDINTNTSFKPRSIFEVLSVSKESNKK